MTRPIQDSVALARSQQLRQLIRQEIISAGGFISFARFMELALYTPTLGYYNNAASPFGHGGDFITAPLISPLFTRCIAQQFQSILTELKTGNILEIGAGSGIFAKDALLELEKLGCLPEHYFIYEISDTLRQQQKDYLQTACPHLLPRVQWLNEPPKAFVGIIFANEVIDALPVQCFRIENNTVKERCVAIENGQFAWRIVPATQKLSDAVNRLNSDFPDGYESEINLLLTSWIQALSNMLEKGVILLFDYGYERREYYRAERQQGTMMCFHQHRSHDDPLQLVGLQDITAHVDFTAVAENAVAANLSVAGYTTQAGFLLACGMLTLAEQTHLTDIELYEQGQAIKKLMLPSQMGELVKVMGLSKAFDSPLNGFALQDRRRDL